MYMGNNKVINMAFQIIYDNWISQLHIYQADVWNFPQLLYSYDGNKVLFTSMSYLMFHAFITGLSWSGTCFRFVIKLKQYFSNKSHF